MGSIGYSHHVTGILHLYLVLAPHETQALEKH